MKLSDGGSVEIFDMPKGMAVLVVYDKDGKAVRKTPPFPAAIVYGLLAVSAYFAFTDATFAPDPVGRRRRVVKKSAAPPANPGRTTKRKSK